MFRIIITIAFILLAFSTNATYKFIPNGNSQNIKLPESPITPYPFNHVDESHIGYDSNTSWDNAVFKGFGSYNGNKTIKMYFPNGVATVFLTFDNPKNIKEIHVRIIAQGSNGSYGEFDIEPTNTRDRIYNTNNGIHNVGKIPADGSWKIGYFSTIRESNRFYFGANNGDPVTYEIYVIEE